jgi:hypothetical protein
MIFDGLPMFISITNVETTNTTGNRTWTNITSEHVITYWRNRSYTNVNITSVQTNVINQFLEPTDITTIVLRTRVIYDQQIRYTWTGPDSPLETDGDNTTLFLRPFRTNSQPYSDELQGAFQTENRVDMLEVATAGQYIVPASPSMPSAPSTEEDNLETLVIVAIVLGSFAAAGMILLVVVWYVTQRKPDEFVPDGSQQDIGMVPPPVEDPRASIPQETDNEIGG